MLLVINKRELKELIMDIADQVIATQTAVTGVQTSLDNLAKVVAAIVPSDNSALLAAVADVRAQLSPTPAATPAPAPVDTTTPAAQ